MGGHPITKGSPGPAGVRQTIRRLRETFADRRIVAEGRLAERRLVQDDLTSISKENP